MRFFDKIENFEKEFGSAEINLSDKEQTLKVNLFAEELYKDSGSSNELKELESQLIKVKKNYSLFTHLAVKLALSKKYLSEINRPVCFTIIFAVYKEHNRILTAKEHPNGEDFLMQKISQIESLTADFPNITWDMIIVDDGCPEGSGKIAENILSERYKGNNVKVLYLQDAIDKKLAVAEGLNSTNDSRKGGAIEYGMWYAVQKSIQNRIIVYTDADLSTNLGQIGLLAKPIIFWNQYAAIASRREDASIVLKKGIRNARGKLFIYLWKRVIRRLNYITDTQCGFKAFRADIVKEIILYNFEKKFAFDIELLIKTDILKRESISKVPIAWIDSEAESTTVDLQPYVEMLKSVSKMYFKYLPANAFSHSFAFFLKNLDQEKWNVLIDHVPEGILIKSAIHYDKYDEIKVPVFEKIIEEYT
jgi:glycosyltransferase involved in cell wall biosynthesis